MTDTAETRPFPEPCLVPTNLEETETQNAHSEDPDEPRAWRRRAYRIELEHEGYTVDAIAAKFRARWDFGILRSYRLANGLSLADAVYQYNAMFGLSQGQPGYLHLSVLGKFEAYPDGVTSRQPAISVLVGLAIIYQTKPQRLLDPAARDRYSPADLFLLDTYRPPLLPPNLP